MHVAARLALLAALLTSAAGCRSAGLSPERRAEVDAARARLVDRTRDDTPPLESEVLALPGDGAHAVSLLHAGCDALTARLHLVRAARESVDIQTFIWADDDSGRMLFAECVRAARRGVRVRLLVDQMGLRASENLIDSTLAHANLSVRLYNPVANASRTRTSEMLMSGMFRYASMNQRMHNKLLLVDRHAAILGGRNVQDRYFDADPTFDYIDRDALVVGPVVDEMQASFDAYWEHPTALPAEHLRDVGARMLERLERPRPLPELPSTPARMAWADERGSRRTWAEVAPHSRLFEGVERVDYEADPPGKAAADEEQDDDHRDAVLDLTEEYVWLQSNYLVFSSPSFRNLSEFRARRPDVDLHYSTNSLAASGAFYVYGISRKQRFRMLHLGLQIHEMRPHPEDAAYFVKRYGELAAEAAQEAYDVPDEYEERLVLDEDVGPQLAIHAKSISIDGRIAVISSHNFDPRSEYHNTEASIAVWDERVCADLERELVRVCRDGNSWRVGPADRVPVWNGINLVGESISRELPIFDIWPWRYASCYELREGMQPVDTDDPRFHDHYRRVGQFPEVPFGWKDLKTRMFSAFFGFTTSLM